MFRCGNLRGLRPGACLTNLHTSAGGCSCQLSALLWSLCKRIVAKLCPAEQRAEDGLMARAAVQMLKFGREIDLSLLEQMGPALGADELQLQLQQQEKAFAADLKEWDRKIAARTEELVALTQENTTHLETVANLTSQQKLSLIHI